MYTSTLRVLSMALILMGVAACGGSEKPAATPTETPTTTTTGDTGGDTGATETPNTSGEQTGAPTSSDAAADSTAPTVLTLKTGTGATVEPTGTEVPVDSTFLVTFSEAMNPDTVTSTTVTWSCVVDETAGDAEPVVTAVEGNTAFTVTRTDALPNSATCTITVTTGVKDAAGNTLASAAAFTFTTPAGAGGGDDGGDTPGGLTVTVKTGAGSAVATSGSIVTTAATFVATFSAAMNPETVTGTSVTLTCNSNPVPANLAKVAEVGDDGIADNAWTLTPTDAGGLPSGVSDCVLTFGTANTDAAGNALTETAFTFATCGTSDDFSNANSLGVCWNAATDNTGKLTTSQADGTATFTIAADVATAGSQIGFTKDFSDATLVVNATIAGLTGLFATADESGNGDMTSIQLSGGQDKSAFCGAMGSDGNGLTILFFVGTPGPENLPATATIGSGSGLGTGETLVLTLSKSGNDFTCAHTFNGGATTPVGVTKSLDIGATYTGGLFFSNVAGTDPLNVVIDAVQFTGT